MYNMVEHVYVVLCHGKTFFARCKEGQLDAFLEMQFNERGLWYEVLDVVDSSYNFCYVDYVNEQLEKAQAYDEWEQGGYDDWVLIDPLATPEELAEPGPIHGHNIYGPIYHCPVCKDTIVDDIWDKPIKLLCDCLRGEQQ
jgi:hypothetical protein